MSRMTAIGGEYSGRQEFPLAFRELAATGKVSEKSEAPYCVSSNVMEKPDLSRFIVSDRNCEVGNRKENTMTATLTRGLLTQYSKANLKPGS
jgi:hypothetical protein